AVVLHALAQVERHGSPIRRDCPLLGQARQRLTLGVVPDQGVVQVLDEWEVREQQQERVEAAEVAGHADGQRAAPLFGRGGRRRRGRGCRWSRCSRGCPLGGGGRGGGRRGRGGGLGRVNRLGRRGSRRRSAGRRGWHCRA